MLREQPTSDDLQLSGLHNHFRFVQWDITSKCNLRCAHCRSESFYGASDLGKDMALPEVKDRLGELAQKGIRRIHFLGGEPFVRRDLEDIVTHASSLGIICSVNTNGTLITKDRAEAIVEAGLYLLTFSLDGPDAETNDEIRGAGSFDRTLQGIENVLNARKRLGGHIRLICSHVLMRPGLGRVAEMVDLCSSIGLQNLIVTPLRRMGGAIRAFDQLSVSDEEKFAACEALARRIAAGGFKCNVQVEIASLLEKLFLNAKYGIGMHVGRAGCTALASKAYLQPDGALFPCQDVAREVGKKSARSKIQMEGVAAWDSDRFMAIPKSIQGREAYRKYIPCNRCPALGRLCVPCPLPGVRGSALRKDGCSRIMSRARREGIDLREAVEKAAQVSVTSRILQEPLFRRTYVSAEAEEWPTELGEVQPQTKRLGDFRETLISEMQGMIAKGLGAGAVIE